MPLSDVVGRADSAAPEQIAATGLNVGVVLLLTVIVAVAVAVHPFASVTVTVYVPAISPVAVGVVCTGVVFHEYVYAGVPPAGVTVAVPVVPPKQFTFVPVAVAVKATAGASYEIFGLPGVKLGVKLLYAI